MATATAKTYDDAAKTGRPNKKAVFASKRQRKAYRKTLRSMVANKLVDKSLTKSEKREYYRTLRLVKLRRRKVAAEMWQLVAELGGLHRDVNRVNDRVRGSNPAMVAAAAGLVNDAVKAASEKANEYAAFSRKSVLRYCANGKD